MKLLLAVVFFVSCLALGSCDYCDGTLFGYSSDWTCTYGCCYSFYRCCITDYYWPWYNYVGIVCGTIFFICLVIAGACGGWRYRRYYVVRRTYQPVAAPTTTVVAATTTTGYQPAPAQYGGQAYNNPPPYNPQYK